MDAFSLDIVNQAVTNLFAGIAFALINVIVSYFAPMLPRVITVLTWQRLKTALIAAYLIALVFQVATSPYFRSLTTPVMVEFAWSPYQAVFNVLGVVVVDLIVMAWKGLRRGAEVGGKQLEVARTRAAEELAELSERASAAVTPEDAESHAARRQAQQAADAAAVAERKQRIDDRLKDY